MNVSGELAKQMDHLEVNPKMITVTDCFLVVVGLQHVSTINSKMSQKTDNGWMEWGDSGFNLSQ